MIGWIKYLWGCDWSKKITSLTVSSAEPAWRWDSQRSWPEAFFSLGSVLRSALRVANFQVKKDNIKESFWDQGTKAVKEGMDCILQTVGKTMNNWKSCFILIYSKSTISNRQVYLVERYNFQAFWICSRSLIVKYVWWKYKLRILAFSLAMKWYYSDYR